MHLTKTTLALTLILVLPALLPPSLRGQDAGGKLVLRYYCGAGSDVGVDRDGREAALDSLVAVGSRIDSVLIEGFTSPDGRSDVNASLSLRRAQAVAAVLSQRPSLKDVPLRAAGHGEWWAGIEDYVRSTADPVVVRWREPLLKVIAEEADPDRRDRIIRQKGGGAPWVRICRDVYREARRVDVTVWYSRPEEPAVEETVSDMPDFTVLVSPSAAVTVLPEDEALFAAHPAVDVYLRPGEAPWRWALRTNLFVPLLNIGGEVYLGPRRHLSIGADWWYPWLRPLERSGRWCLEAQALTADLRWTFRRGDDPRLQGTGPSLALAAGAGYFDVAWDAAGRQGEFACAGLDLRWLFPVGRCRLGLSAAAGFAYMQSRPYHVYEDGRAYRDGQWSETTYYWGPLRAGFDLIVPLRHQERKEGCR